jgi:hypothetical protein
MSYHFSKTCDLAFDDAVSKVAADLKDEGFGILTEINVQETLKRKLNVDFIKYKMPASFLCLPGSPGRRQSRSDAALQRHHSGATRRESGGCGRGPGCHP